MADVPVGDIYKGPCGIGRDSPWLTNEDIPHDRDVTVTIENIVLHPKLVMQGGRDKTNALSVGFVGKERRLLLNATNRKVLAALFGANTADWFGKRVILHVEADVRRPDGTKGPAVRIRAKRVEQEKAAPATVGSPSREPGDDRP